MMRRVLAAGVVLLVSAYSGESGIDIASASAQPRTPGPQPGPQGPRGPRGPQAPQRQVPPGQPEIDRDRERIPVLTFNQQLSPDPQLADQQIVLPPPYRNRDWPQTGGAASHSPRHLALGDALERAWDVDIGKGSDLFTRLIMSPVVADGRVFAIDTRGLVSAYRTEDGERLWETRVEGEGEAEAVAFGGGVAYGDGRLFVTTGFGFLTALDPETGEELWRYRNIVPLRGPPAVSRGRVFAVSQDNQLLVIDGETGELAWTQAGLPEEAAMLGAAAPAIGGNTVVAGFSSGELMAMRVENGQRVWQDTLSRTRRLTPLASLTDIDADPVVADSTAYAVGHAGVMVAIDMRSGERIWESNVAGVQMPWVTNPYIFLVTVDGELVSLLASNGGIRWVTQMQRFEKPESREGPVAWSGPVLAGDRLILVSSNGFLVTVSPYTGEFLSARDLPAGAVVPPVVADGTLYVLTEDADLIAYR